MSDMTPSSGWITVPTSVRTLDASRLLNVPQQYARIHVQPSPGVNSWPVVERVHGGWQSGEHYYPDAMVVSIEPLSIMPANEKLVLFDGWVCADTGEHNCAGGTPEASGMHEPRCGLEPLIKVEDLPAGSGASLAVDQLVRGLEREGGSLVLVHAPGDGQWNCAVTFGRVASGSCPAAGAAYGVASTAATALQQAVAETGWS